MAARAPRDTRRTAAGTRRRGAPRRIATASPSPTETGADQRVAEIQRSRLLVATVGAIERVGYNRATVAQITEQARVSRRTFYELFANREECVAAVLRGAAEQVRSALAAADLAGLSWRERMRRGLWTILRFLDREPALARVMVIDSQRDSGTVLVEREAIVRRLVAAVDAGRREQARTKGCTELTAEGVLGAILAIVQRDLTREDRRREPLQRLFPELLGIILLPYLAPAEVRREQARTAPAPAAGDRSCQPPAPAASDPLAGLQMRVTYRTVRVLEGLSLHAGASNRQIADFAGITTRGRSPSCWRAWSAWGSSPT